MTKTVLEVLQSTTAYFEKRAIDNPRLNAEHLLAHALQLSRMQLYLEFERQLTENELAPLRELVRRRGEGEPLQHLLGTVEFCGLTFLCDRRALVPRPETEELVELVAARIEKRSDLATGRVRPTGGPSWQLSRIVDVGTGSGVIALSLATKFPEATVFAVDISEEALALARENAERLALAERIQFRRGDLLEGLNERFDVIVANLPYIATGDRQTLSREVLRDPDVALFAGQMGHELIRRLIDQAPANLEPEGLLALEIGLGQADVLREFLAQKKWRDIEAKNDYSGVIRFLFARYG